MSDTRALTQPAGTAQVLAPMRRPPALVQQAGNAACFAWEEFFAAHLRNPHTRAAYSHAVRRFLAWLEPRAIKLTDIMPAHVGAYFDEHRGSPATRKLHLAALRAFFDRLVLRHALIINPAAAVRGERYQVIEGKTPEISKEQATRLLGSIGNTNVVDARDRAILGVLVFTAARAGAVAKLRRKDLVHDGTSYTLRFQEKGGKAREIPVRSDLEKLLLEYLRQAEDLAMRDAPLFRTANRRSGTLTAKAMTGVDLYRLVKRRAKKAGLPQRISPHSFRVFTVTDLLSHGAKLEDVQSLAGHADPRTTRLYDRRPQRITRNIVERISLDLENSPPTDDAKDAQHP